MEPRTRHTLPKTQRIGRSSAYRHTIRTGPKTPGKYIILYATPNTAHITRIGAGTTRRLGNSPQRNRAKRLVREAFRLTKHALPLGLDLIILPKIPWQSPTLEELKTDLTHTVARAAARLAQKQQEHE